MPWMRPIYFRKIEAWCFFTGCYLEHAGAKQGIVPKNWDLGDAGA